MPHGTPVWVVEVHAKAINAVESGPPGFKQQPYTDFSVVMNARTGRVSDGGGGNFWPLPLWKVCTSVGLPPPPRLGPGVLAPAGHPLRPTPYRSPATSPLAS